ncbi:MAG: NUDIX domain-containing protein [Pseudomonadales bacterium]|nr:NUDIX domain-containing protein [Pseudomonadales bacterium]NRA16114.1 NUDIX domain-containing protein [Oceanospirillaceae bacterium]
MHEISSVAWVYQQNDEVLCVKTRGKDKFFIPGGKLNHKESNESALQREILEELSVTLSSESIKHLVTIQELAYGLDNTLVNMHCFTADFQGEIQTNSEIEIAMWIGLDNIALCAPAAQRVLEQVLEKNSLIASNRG